MHLPRSLHSPSTDRHLLVWPLIFRIILSNSLMLSNSKAQLSSAFACCSFCLLKFWEVMNFLHLLVPLLISGLWILVLQKNDPPVYL